MQKIRFRKNLAVGPFYPYQTSSTLFLFHWLWMCLFLSFYGLWWACNCTVLNAFLNRLLVRLHEHNPREWLSHKCTCPSVHPASFLPGLWERSTAVKPPAFSKVQFTTLHICSAVFGPPPVIGEMRLELLVCDGGCGNTGGLSAWSGGVKTKEIGAVCDSSSAWDTVVMDGVHKTLSA